MSDVDIQSPVAGLPQVPAAEHDEGREKSSRWRAPLGRSQTTSLGTRRASISTTGSGNGGDRPPRARWNMGMLNDPETDAVPGSVLLLSKPSEFNEPLGMESTPARTSASSLPFSLRRRPTARVDKKRTADGRFVLEPQPDDSLNDPLNWQIWRRDVALISLGFYCMVGGGMTPVLAAGFPEVAQAYDVTVPQVALTTGLYMLGLGLGSVILSPTAILYGKRPVYLAAAICFVLSAIWCALSPNFTSLCLARIFQGLAVSSVECLPSATVAEIYFLHEKAYRLGIYTLLLLGGKNLVPLVSAVIIQALGWRWVFWIVALVVGFAACLLFLFVPETFWDRSPVPPRPRPSRSASGGSIFSLFHRPPHAVPTQVEGQSISAATPDAEKEGTPKRAHFSELGSEESLKEQDTTAEQSDKPEIDADNEAHPEDHPEAHPPDDDPEGLFPPAPGDEVVADYFAKRNSSRPTAVQIGQLESQTPMGRSSGPWMESSIQMQLSPATSPSIARNAKPANAYTSHYSRQPPKSFLQQLAPYSGRLKPDEKWLHVAARPFILFAYPSILWSTLVYSLSIGWLIVLSESVSTIYQNRDTYNFTPLQTGLVYISPFIGGVLGTAVAGKCSDLVVRYMARRNGGIYEPEFRLVMAIPMALTTSIGLMGYGWSAAERDNFYIPTFFFGLISFGCSLGSTTSITFAVDSYRQFAGEALVTLNFSKNVFHGLVFSLFFNSWLARDGPKEVFLVIGAVQFACLVVATVPMYIFGKRGRMWTVRRKLMERF